VGILRLNGDLNTGVTIRTAHLRDGVASYSAGATLLYDSVPALEAQETRIKATNFFRALAGPPSKQGAAVRPRVGAGLKALVVDCGDCFAQTLADYVRQTGAEVVTYRAGFPLDLISRIAPALTLLTPGAGAALVQFAARAGAPLFAVGIQAVVEAFGGRLCDLAAPVRASAAQVTHTSLGVFAGLPTPFQAARYQARVARRETVPACLEVTAQSEDGAVMGLRHRELKIEAVDFRPESILTSEWGRALIENAVRACARMLS